MVTTFLLYDVYNFFMYIYSVFKTLKLKLRYHQLPIYVTNAYVICQDTGKGMCVTEHIANGTKYNFDSTNFLVYVYYIVNNKTYSMVYHNTKPLPFPPYNINECTKKIRPAIVEYNVDGNTDYTNLFLQFSGPKQNFYADIDSHVTPAEWILNEEAEEIMFMNSFGIRSQLDPETLKII